MFSIVADVPWYTSSLLQSPILLTENQEAALVLSKNMPKMHQIVHFAQIFHPVHASIPSSNNAAVVFLQATTGELLPTSCKGLLFFLLKKSDYVYAVTTLNFLSFYLLPCQLFWLNSGVGLTNILELTILCMASLVRLRAWDFLSTVLLCGRFECQPWHSSWQSSKLQTICVCFSWGNQSCKITAI